MTVFLVYQTTPLLGGVRPICCFESKRDAKEYCVKCNEQGNGFNFLEINMYERENRH